ncbi:M28 family peptidase [Dyadobacter aurulentus]|uniref:M28 family peptidase n=1 Tax=Dyadobacter sp. UC 10 TaxID=2605428 RepID=UPI0011F378A8|nr:M28 family peptidase [Dyadobacter sp. UC 10]KAA0990771.1 M20/M25/M40 family metallo-hydrolase [Dyadobacter sp. UC 10]
MKKTILLILFVGAMSFQPSFAQKKSPALPEFQIKKSETEAHMRFLAADELMGRRTGESGNFVAARYVAEQFRKLGLSPVTSNAGSNTVSYFQNVPFEKMGASAAGEIIADAEIMKAGEAWLLMNGGETNLKAPIIYASFGLEDAAKSWDDYKGLDVKGKIVLVESGTPEAQTPTEIFATSNEKRKLAASKGAIGIIELFNAPVPWNIVLRAFGGEKLALSQGDAAATPSIPHAWVNGKEAKYARALRAVKEVEFKTTGRKMQLINSYNVAGLIQGSDPKLKDEYVLLTAHYDHVGVGRQGGQPYTAEDSIFNGARDNAFGTVALLTAAEALSKNPPKRSVLIVALTGEEVGLLGSKYYAANPLLPLNKCIFNLNSDGAGYNDTTIVAVMGLDRTGARAEIETASKAFGLGVFADPSPEQGLFDRSDNVSFAREGIPAPTFTPGFREFNGDIMKNYHQVSDNPETINFNYLLKFSQAYTYTARLIADRKVAPQWSAGDKYEPAAKKLYGK